MQGRILIDAKISWKSIYMRYFHSLLLSLHKILINYKEKSRNFTVENLENTTWTKWSKLTSPAMSHTDMMFLLMWCTQGVTLLHDVFAKLQSNNEKHQTDLLSWEKSYEVSIVQISQGHKRMTNYHTRKDGRDRN